MHQLEIDNVRLTFLYPGFARSRPCLSILSLVCNECFGELIYLEGNSNDTRPLEQLLFAVSAFDEMV